MHSMPMVPPPSYPPSVIANSKTSAAEVYMSMRCTDHESRKVCGSAVSRSTSAGSSSSPDSTGVDVGLLFEVPSSGSVPPGLGEHVFGYVTPPPGLEHSLLPALSSPVARSQLSLPPGLDAPSPSPSQGLGVFVSELTGAALPLNHDIGCELHTGDWQVKGTASPLPPASIIPPPPVAPPRLASPATDISAQHPVPPPPLFAPPPVAAPSAFLAPPPMLAPPAMIPNVVSQSFLEGPPAAPAAGFPSLPTLGSAGHIEGSCKPCAFVHKQGCERGVSCPFCHLCDASQITLRRKEKRAALAAKKRGCKSGSAMSPTLAYP